MYVTLMKYSTYWEPQKYVIFVFQLCHINQKKNAEGLEALFSWSQSTPLPITHIFDKRFVTTSWNKLILHEDMKRALLILFLV